MRERKQTRCFLTTGREIRRLCLEKWQEKIVNGNCRRIFLFWIMYEVQRKCCSLIIGLFVYLQRFFLRIFCCQCYVNLYSRNSFSILVLLKSSSPGCFSWRENKLRISFMGAEARGGKLVLFLGIGCFAPRPSFSKIGEKFRKYH